MNTARIGSLHGPRRRALRGATMVEVLVSILILSLGILAMASMLSAATRYSKTSELRSVATLLANDYADRMRANRTAVTAGNYNLTAAYSAAKITSAVTPSTCGGTGCTASDLAAIDVQQWKNSLFYGLPAPAAFAQYDATDQSVDLWVAWQDPAADSGQPVGQHECPANFTGSPAPRCVYFRIGL